MVERSGHTRRAILRAAASCAPVLAAMTLACPAPAQTPADILLYEGPDREQKLIVGAKKEGQVIIYSALIVNQAMRPIAEKFGKKYPFIKMSYWRADSEDIAAKLSAEVRQQCRG